MFQGVPGVFRGHAGGSDATPNRVMLTGRHALEDTCWKTRDRSVWDRARVGLRRLAVEQPPDTRFDLGFDASSEHMPMNIRRLGVGDDLNARDAQTYSHVVNGRRAASPVR
jgi:hypothetical protein